MSLSYGINVFRALFRITTATPQWAVVAFGVMNENGVLAAVADPASGQLINPSNGLPFSSGTPTISLPLTGAGPFIQPSIPGGEVIQNSTGNEILGFDSDNNAFVQGWFSEAAADQINFNSTGVASVTSASDGAQLPITRTVGTASLGLYSAFNEGNPCPPGNSVDVQVSVANAIEGDTAEISFDQDLSSAWATGGLVVAGVSVAAGVVTVQFGNTSTSPIGPNANYMSVKVTR